MSQNKPSENVDQSRMNERYDPIIEADHVCESKHEDSPAECRTERGTHKQLEMNVDWLT